MISIRALTAIAAASIYSMAMAQDTITSSSILFIPTPTATLPASEMTTIGCFETGTPLEDHGVGYFTTPGSCQQICIGLNKNVMGLSDGTNCWCGDLIPAEEWQTDNSTCDTTCAGDKRVLCGGPSKLWVILTGNSRNRIEHFKPSSSSSSSAAAAKTSAPAATSPSETADEPEKKDGPNKAGIAAGVVVGVLGLAAIIGGVFFWLRQKRRREVEEEYRRQAANVNSFVNGGKLHTSNSSMTDSRLDPDFMNRRQSNGSIADNEDYSRRILKVTNA